jgi:tetratricopeptide (TPR) repeat protein
MNTALSQVPNGAAGVYLLGQICEKQAKRKEAKEYYNRALSMDPTLWSAFERLCKLQANIDPMKYFTDNHIAMAKLNDYIRQY